MIRLCETIKMWKPVSVLLMLTFFWSYVLSDDCLTPLGMKSKCVSLYDCPDLVAVLKQKPPSSNIHSFLKRSQCGFNGQIPKVCCGPVPNKTSDVGLTPDAGVGEDSAAHSDQDSFPASRNQCGTDRDGDRIYSGKIAEHDEFPWLALLGYTKKSTTTYQCGGALINRRYVLTAAHCIGYREDEFGHLTSIRLGEHDMSANATVNCPYKSCGSRLQEIVVASAHAHPNFQFKDNARTHDIAIVKLAKRATYTYYVQPICLVTKNELPTAGERAIIAGWGETLLARSSNIKMKLSLPIFDRNSCFHKFLKKQISLNDNQFCAGGIFKEDSCNRDSGNPLMMKALDNRWEAVGVVSFGMGCGMDGWPAVYTSVGRYLSWIKQTLASTNQR